MRRAASRRRRPAGLRRRGLRRADEELHARLLLDAADLVAQRGLGEAELSAAAARLPGFVDRLDRAEVAELDVQSGLMMIVRIMNLSHIAGGPTTEGGVPRSAMSRPAVKLRVFRPWSW
jgi:hypothetical protein